MSEPTEELKGNEPKCFAEAFFTAEDSLTLIFISKDTVHHGVLFLS